jgi:hypothetical protein
VALPPDTVEALVVEMTLVGSRIIDGHRADPAGQDRPR